MSNVADPAIFTMIFQQVFEILSCRFANQCVPRICIYIYKRMPAAMCKLLNASVPKSSGTLKVATRRNFASLLFFCHPPSLSLLRALSRVCGFEDNNKIKKKRKGKKKRRCKQYADVKRRESVIERYIVLRTKNSFGNSFVFRNKVREKELGVPRLSEMWIQNKTCTMWLTHTH